jgi:hypothetical protein
MMVTVLVSSAAMSLQIDQNPSRQLGVGIVATTKDDDVPCVIFSVLAVVTSCVIAPNAPFIWLEVIVDLVASTVPPTSSVGQGILVNVV